jgi:hypothetical protein
VLFTRRSNRPRHSIERIFLPWHNIYVAWSVEFTDGFEEWWNALSEDEQIEIDAKVELLQEYGPTLPRPV